jgi:hypothetical protein
MAKIIGLCDDLKDFNFRHKDAKSRKKTKEIRESWYTERK